MLLIGLASALLRRRSARHSRRTPISSSFTPWSRTARGAPLRDLRPSSFIVYEDNRPQEISFFASTDAPPPSDCSSTTAPAWRPNASASWPPPTAVCRAEQSGRRNFVLAFNEHVREAWAPRVIDDSDLSVLRSTLLNRISARGVRPRCSTPIDRRSRSPQQSEAHASGARDHQRRQRQCQPDRRSTRCSRAFGRANAMIYTCGAAGSRRSRRQSEASASACRATTGGESFTPKRDRRSARGAAAHRARYSCDLHAWLRSRPIRPATARCASCASSHDIRTAGALKVQTRGGYVAPRRVNEGGVGAR